METTAPRRSSDISPDTLLVASVGSATATVVIGRFGLAGTLLGAALFPVVLAFAKELARRPARRLPEAVRPRQDTAVDEREEKEARDQRARTFRERLADVRWRRVLLTAAVAFAAVVALFTLAELTFGRSLVADRPTTFFSPTGEQAPPADDPGAPPPAEPQEEEGPPAEEPAEPPAEEEPPPAPVPPEEPPAEEPPPEGQP